MILLSCQLKVLTDEVRESTFFGSICSKPIMKYVIGADVGTTSLKAVLFDEALNPLKTVMKDYTLNTSGDYVEFPAEEYWRLFSEAYEELSAGYEIAALSIEISFFNKF